MNTVIPWYKSKVVWAGVVQTLIGILGILAELLAKATITPDAVVLAVSGALVVIFRIWFSPNVVTQSAQ
jgi:Na+-translocating ferredoxin:NAD+ oxidoreductase RnfG subunit